MKVLLLNPPTKHGTAIVRDNLYGCWCRGKANYMWPPIILAGIGSILKQAGMDVVLLDAMAEKINFDKTRERVKEINPDYVILYTATDSFANDIEIVGLFKKDLPNLKSIFAGTHVTILPDQSLKEEAIDFIILGEPDFVSRDLILALEKGEKIEKIKGIGFKEGGKIKTTGIAPLIEDLDSLPFPDRTLVPNLNYFNPLAQRMPYTTMFSTRGCPFRCIYCASISLYGKKFRARSAKNVVDEMEECAKKFGIKEIFFRDETFTLEKKRVLDICKEIKNRKLDITWMCNSRVDTIDKEMMVEMKKAGCHTIKYGVESGVQKTLDTLCKGITVEKTRQVFKWMHEVGLNSVAHFMIGSPGETREDIVQTIKFSKEINPDFVSFNITTPYPGTPLFDSYVKKVNLENYSTFDIEKAHEKAIFNTAWSNLTKEEIEQLFDRAHREFYFRPSYIFKRLLKQRSLDEFVRTSWAGLHFIKFSIKSQMEHKKKSDTVWTEIPG
jgi:radical SAM superfamily enzyme YgiQ (UPF0313 family)